MAATIVPAGTGFYRNVTPFLSGPIVTATVAPMETQTQFIERRKSQRAAALVNVNLDILVLEVFGPRPVQAPIKNPMKPGAMFRRQAE